MTDARARSAVAGLAVAGACVAGYLTWVHYAGGSPACLASGGCEKVQSSSYAELGGVPVALVGLVGYLAILAVALRRGELALTAGAALALTALGFSAYLTYLELFVLDAICQWCVASALISAALAPLSVRRLLRQADRPPGDRSRPPRSRPSR